MASTQNPLLVGAALAGGGVAAYFGYQWLIRTCRDKTPSNGKELPPAAHERPRDAAAGSGEANRLVAAQAGGLPRIWDWIFEEYRGEIPIEYLRALAMRESGMDSTARSGPAWGLMQIVDVVRLDYNRGHGTRYQRDELLDPVVNVAIATWLLRTIIRSFARRHPGVPNLQADWGNARFAELLTFGWNAGWSEAGGVGRVATYLEAQGRTDITIDLVHQHAQAAGASRHLANADKVRWCKSVVALYQRERCQFATASIWTS